VSFARISIPLQFKELVAVRQFLLSVNSGKPIATTNLKTGFQREMRDLNGFEWAFCNQCFAAGTPLNWISHKFWLKPLKQIFLHLKSKFPLILKIKYQQFNGNGRPLD
jgi:hypothetical protein